MISTWLCESTVLSAISSASTEICGNRAYSATVNSISTWIGRTHPHGDPRGVFVSGATQTIVLQSSLGGGGGNAMGGLATGPAGGAKGGIVPRPGTGLIGVLGCQCLGGGGGGKCAALGPGP